MVYILLYFAADLENLTMLEPEGGCDDPNFPYFLTLKCENCGEITPLESCVKMSEEVPFPMGKGTVNMVKKCQLCGRIGTIKMIPGQGQPLSIEKSQKKISTRLMVFDCRGLMPLHFFFAHGWKALSAGGKSYDIDLSAGEYAEYDDEEKCPLVVHTPRAGFKVVHKKSWYNYIRNEMVVIYD